MQCLVRDFILVQFYNKHKTHFSYNKMHATKKTAINSTQNGMVLNKEHYPVYNLLH